MTQATPPPPRLAVWLIDLFVPEEQAPSVLGDLLEEFSGLAANSGVAGARRWYWRQTLFTVLHLLASGFRTAPWFMAGVLATGIVLMELGNSFTHWSLYKGFNYFNQHVLPLYALHPRLNVFLVNSGMLVWRLSVSLLIGCLVALLSKRREMPATLALSLACSISALTRFLPLSPPQLRDSSARAILAFGLGFALLLRRPLRPRRGRRHRQIAPLALAPRCNLLSSTLNHETVREEPEQAPSSTQVRAKRDLPGPDTGREDLIKRGLYS